ncbi:zinc-ribbon domain-containing protein [Paenibacillus mesophilus]|nr:zinc-ribbon domain-containing protein [Paenibacillus mesophilus]
MPVGGAMNNCVKCGHELTEGSSFCSKCGTKQKEKKSSDKSPLKKFAIPLGIGLLIVIVGVSAVLFINKSPTSKLLNALAGNEYTEAIEIYDKSIKGNTEREKEAETLLKKRIESIKADYMDEKLTFSLANTALDTMDKAKLLQSDVSTAKTEISKLNDSRTAFQTGKEFVSKDKLKEGLVELKKVIESDKNYTNAQEMIKSSSQKYKTAILNEAEQLSANQEFSKAITLLVESNSILSNDPDVAAKKAVYEKQNEEKLAAERKKKMEEAKLSQEVTVASAGIVVQSDKYKVIYPDMIQVVVKNNTDKTVKNMKVSMLGFDSNGLPKKIERRFGSSSFEFIGSAENVNIVAKATFGRDSGWEIDESHGLKTVLACVKEIEYYDGSKWTNPYYEYWLEEYKEKPLH